MSKSLPIKAPNTPRCKVSCRHPTCFHCAFYRVSHRGNFTRADVHEHISTGIFLFVDNPPIHRAPPSKPRLGLYSAVRASGGNAMFLINMLSQIGNIAADERTVVALIRIYTSQNTQCGWANRDFQYVVKVQRRERGR